MKNSNMFPFTQIQLGQTTLDETDCGHPSYGKLQGKIKSTYQNIAQDNDQVAS